MRELKTAAAVLVVVITIPAVAQPTVSIERVVRSAGNSIFIRDLSEGQRGLVPPPADTG